MYRNAYQRGLLTVFHSGGAKPLAIWDTHLLNGHISRFIDHDINALVLEIGGTNVSTAYMVCPKGNDVLGITMPFLVMIVKNLKKYFTFEVTILDDTGVRRRFRVANFQSTTQILPLCTTMPISLSDGWNQIQFNLSEFTRRAYKKQFVEAQKLKINANIRIRRIYFAERLIPEDQLPNEYKLFFPIAKERGKKRIEEKPKDTAPAPTPPAPVSEVAPIAEEGPREAEAVKSIHSVQKRPSAAEVQSLGGAAAAEGAEAASGEEVEVTGEAVTEGEEGAAEAETGEAAPGGEEPGEAEAGEPEQAAEAEAPPEGEAAPEEAAAAEEPPTAEADEAMAEG